LLRPIRRIYARIESTPLRPLLETTPIQRLRQRLRPQLTLGDIVEIAAVLDRADGRWWLAGGWGIDALVGAETRPHGDLDVVLERSAMESAIAALREAGFGPRRRNTGTTYHHVPGSLMPDREEMQDARGRTVDLHPVDAGTWLASTPVDQPFAAGAIAGHAFPCLSADAQRAVRLNYQHSEKDAADLARIRVLPEPEEGRS
jgi:lincosamide nucleotidyltransferase A/C/D/E